MPNAPEPSPSIISHISIGTNDFPRARTFYDAVMVTLGVRRVMEQGESVAYGRTFPEFWVGGRLMAGGLRRVTVSTSAFGPVRRPRSMPFM